MEDKEIKEEKRLVEVSLSVAFVRRSHFKARVWQRGSKERHNVAPRIPLIITATKRR